MTDSQTLHENGSNVADVEKNENAVNTSNGVEKNGETNGDGKTTEETSSAQSDPEPSTAVESKSVVNNDPRDDDMGLKFLNKDFVYECMSVPSHSKKEFRMVIFIILWARRNHIKYEFDEYGNVYLTKGVLSEGEFYPCVTSHMDTVQDRQDPYIYAGVPLDLKTELTADNRHKISVDSHGGASIGIGADDKGGICICLSMFKHIDKLKACFFLDEESGCNGSNNLSTEWFKDVGYVIGYDSPDLHRAAWSCSGVKLFSYEFYTEHMKEVCDKWGLVKGCFFSEPYTDVKNIREKTDIICMNFGNGGYNAHMPGEYSIIEDMDHACGMGVELIQSIGCTEHKLKHLGSNKSAIQYRRTENGTYEPITNDDTSLLRSLGDDTRYGGKGSTTTSSATTYRTVTKKEDELKFDSVKYIVNRYDSHILAIKEELIRDIKKHCKKLKVDFSEIEKIIEEKFNNEIKF